jgi:hypothetical protein
MQYSQLYHLPARALPEKGVVMSNNYSSRFESGDLLEVDVEHNPRVGSPFSIMKHGPILAGLTRRMRYRELRSGDTYLALSDAQESTHHNNRRLYVEVMTGSGPALCWCDAFRMKLKEVEE